MIHIDPTECDLSEAEIAEALSRPRDFGYSGDNAAMFETWALGPVIRTRDSRLAEQSNADALEKALAAAEATGAIEEESYTITGARHWAVGWVDHLSYQVVDDDGQPTLVARFVKCWFKALDEYPLADEDDHSRREFEATFENIEQAGHGLVRDDAPEDWVDSVHEWFDANDPGALESTDDQGGYPSEAQMREALEALDLLDPDYD